MPMGIAIGFHHRISPFMLFLLIFSLLSVNVFLPVVGYISIGLTSPECETEKELDTDHSNVEGSTNRAITPDWPMFGKDSSHTHRSKAISKGVYQPSLKWDKWSQISGNGIDSRATTIGNFSNNINWQLGTYRNVQHVIYADNGFINILDGGTGDYIWQLDVDYIDGTLDNDQVFTTPTLGYFNDNTKLDILFGTTDGNLYLYEPISNYDDTGDYTWSSDNINQEKIWSVETGENFTRASPVLGSLDGDIFPDAVIGTNNRLYAISGAQGKELWKQTVPGSIVSTPVLYADGSDINTLVLVMNQSTTLLNYSASFFNAKSSTGNRLDVKYFDISTLPIPNQIPSPAVAELDGKTSNDRELIISTPYEGLTGNGRVYTYFTNRTLFWATPPNAITGQIEATPAVADLDGDGINEIIIISWRLGTLGPVTHIYAFHGNNGTLLWHVVKDTVGLPPLYTNEQAIASPIISDVNTDGTLDVVFTTSPNIYAIDGKNGTDLWSISLLGTGRELWSTPAAGDIDNDGFLDIVSDGASISHIIIDLTLSSDDVSFSSQNITENEPLTIKAVVHNKGTAVANDIKVSIFENDALIGNDTIGTIPGEDSREIRVDWTPSQEGNRVLKIILDPLNVIEETNEKNNEVTKEVYVIPSYPDIMIRYIEYYRGDGKKIDNENTHLVELENSTIFVEVQNIGGDEGRDIKFRLLDSGSQIGSIRNIGDLKVDEIKNITYNWKPSKGNHDLVYQVDPGNNIFELNESNNQISERVFIKSKVPTNPGFICSGVIYESEGLNTVPGINVTLKNNRTGSKIVTKSNSSGYYKTDLQNIQGLYYEGDEIVIHATDGENQSTISFIIYSEDKSRFDNITLLKMPTYAVAITVDSNGKTIYPNQNVKYNITITNLGNEYNTVNLSLSDVIDVKTNKAAINWDAYLNEYMVVDIAPKKSLSGIVLTVNAPAKPEDAKALDQVLLAITARSFYDSTQSDIVGVTTTVGRLYNFEITSTDPSTEVDPLRNNTVNFFATVKNAGNDDDTVSISIPGVVGWEVKTDDELDLKMGYEKDIEIELQCDDTIEFGTYIFTLNIISIDGKGKSTFDFTVNIIRPDLKFYSNVTTNPINPKLGQTINFNALVYNNGTYMVSNIFIEFRVKNAVTDIQTISNLTSGNYQSITFNWTPINIGSYLVEFIIDPYNDILEEDKENNKISFILNFNQDLALKSLPIFSNSNPKEGEKMDISITIDNIGNVDITESFLVDIFDGDPDNNGNLISSYNVQDGLAANSDKLVEFTWTASGGGKEHEIYIVVNPDKNIDEIDYENNKVSKAILVLKGTSTSSVDDNLAWIFLILIVVAILIIVFIYAIPPKQASKRKRGPGKRVRSRSSYDYDRRKSRKPIDRSPERRVKKSGDIKFIVLDEEDIFEDDSKEIKESDRSDDKNIIEDSEDYDYDWDEDEEDDDYRKSVGSRSRKMRSGENIRGKKKKRPGLFGALFSGFGRVQPKRKRARYSEKPSRKRPVNFDEEDDSDEDIEPQKPIKRDIPRSKRSSDGQLTKKGDRSEGVEVIGIGESELDDDFYYEDEDVDEDYEETRSRSKHKGKSKPKEPKEKDMSWEYSQLIGIR
jgi:subtilase family serine protease